MLRSLSLPAIPVLLLVTGLATGLTAGDARAQNENPLTRDEVSIIKKKMVAVLEALGQPAGYSLEHENFNLPAEAYKNTNTGKYNLISGSADRKFGTQKKT